MMLSGRASAACGDLKGLLASVDFTFTGHDRSARDLRTCWWCSAKIEHRDHSVHELHCHRGWSDGVKRTPPVLFHVQWEIPA